MNASRRYCLLAILLLLTLCLIAGETKNPPKTPPRIKIANVSLDVRFPDNGWDFAVVYSSGNWSAWHNIPPGQASGSDGVRVGKTEDFALAEAVFQTGNEDELGASTAREINFELTNPDSKLKGKAFLIINAANGERKVYARPYNSKFKNGKTQELNDSLISLIGSCKIK